MLLSGFVVGEDEVCVCVCGCGGDLDMQGIARQSKGENT